MELANIEKTVSNIIVQSQHIPFLLLQAMAIVGCVSILLIYRNKFRLLSTESIDIGVIMGLACFFMMMILYKQMQPSLKLTLVLDFIFLSGVLGGWRNVLVTLAIVSLSRLLIGGTANIGAALLDYTFFAMSSVLPHVVLLHRYNGVLNFKNIFLLILWRFTTGEAAILFIWLLGMIPTEHFTTMVIRRALAAWTISVCIIVPIMLLVRQTTALTRRMFYDPISQLPNRRAMEHRLHEVLRSKTLRRVPRVLLLIKVDNFALLTQNNGYTWMDRFCAVIGQELRTLCQQRAFTAFTPQPFSFAENVLGLVLRNTSHSHVQQTGLAQRIHSALQLALRQPRSGVQPSLSISVTDIILNDDFDEDRFLRSLSLLNDNQSGTVLFFEPTFTQQVAQNEYILTCLKHWEEYGGVPLWFQPKVMLAEGCCYGAEALLRVPEETGSGYINPHGLLIAAEKYKMRQCLEWGIVVSAIECLANLPPPLKHLQISVNLTPDSFMEPNFALKILARLEDCEVAPQRLVVEVIETSKFIATDVVQDNIARLIEAGIKLSLDDFGTGYASISLLSRYHFRELKLDYSMISNLDSPRMREAVLLSIEGARRYESCVVAEGIETELQRQMLLEMGVLHGQGYLFGKAMPFDAFVAYAQRKKCIQPPH